MEHLSQVIFRWLLWPSHTCLTVVSHFLQHLALLHSLHIAHEHSQFLVWSLVSNLQHCETTYSCLCVIHMLLDQNFKSSSQPKPFYDSVQKETNVNPITPHHLSYCSVLAPRTPYGSLNQSSDKVLRKQHPNSPRS